MTSVQELEALITSNESERLEFKAANQRRGSSFAELADVLPSQSKRQVKALLQELKNEGRIRAEGVTRSARWYPGLDK